MIFVVHVGALVSSSSDVHLSCHAQIASLKADEAHIAFPSGYTDVADVFIPDLAAKVPEHTGMKDHAINPIIGKQPSYGPIYNLRPMELEILKIYVKTNLANGFIRSFKSPANIFILFIWKLDSSLHFYVDYQGLNNLIIRN